MSHGTWNISAVLEKITWNGMPVTNAFKRRPRPRHPHRRLRHPHRRRRRCPPPPPPPPGSVHPVHCLQMTEPLSTQLQSNGAVWRKSMLPRWKIYETNTTF